MNRETLKKALEAEANERIECPVCGDEIPAFELSTDHAHSKELLNTILELLTRTAGPCRGHTRAMLGLTEKSCVKGGVSA